MSAASRLERAIVASAARAGARIEVRRHAAVSWRSATFAGDRHQLEASAVSGARLDAWLDAIGEDAVRVPGHVVAELAVRDCVRADGTTRFCLHGITVANG